MSKLKDIAYITKLAGFEHTKYIQGNCTHEKKNKSDKPLFIGKTVRNGTIDENFDWYISSNISEKLPRSQLNKKCIVLPYVGSVGDLAIFDGTYKAHLGSNIAKLELNDNCEFSEEFIYYYLKSPFGQKNLLKDIQGAVQKNITMDAIRNVEIPNIEKSKQTKIVNVLLGLDKKILNNNNIISELEAMAKTIYDYWFLQYEFPNEEGKPYKSSGGKMVYNEEIKKEIPLGWKIENIINNSISSVIMPGITKFEGTKNYLATANVNNSDIQDGDWITYNNRESRANMQPMVNSVWFAKMKNSVKHITFTKESDSLIDKYILSTGFLGIKCQENALSYIKCFIYSDNFERQKDILAHGATQEAVNNTDLKNIKIQIPKDNILNKFSNYTYNLLDMQNKIIQENQELTKLRDELLPLLMNGQVSFKS